MSPAITSLSVLLGRIMEVVDEKTHRIPACLQSLGCVFVWSVTVVKQTTQQLKSLDSIHCISSFIMNHSESDSFSSIIADYGEEAIKRFREPVSLPEETLVPYSDEQVIRKDESEADESRSMAMKDELLMILLYRLFGRGSDRDLDSENDMTDRSDTETEFGAEDYHLDNNTALLHMFERLLSGNDGEDHSNLYSDSIKSYLAGKIRSLEDEELEEGIENTMEGKRDEVDPDEILSGSTRDLSLFKLLGYIPNDDPSLSETENDESEDVPSRQRIEGNGRREFTE